MNTTNTGLKILFNFFLILVMICSPISTAFSQQTITSSCTSPKKVDVHPIGIHDEGNKIIPLDSGTNRTTIECTCRDKNTGPCPNTVTFTIRKPNGTTQQVVATSVTVNVGSDYTGGYPMKIYRAIYSGTANRVTYNAPATASRPSMRGLVVWQESVGNGIPNIPNNYIVDRFFYRQPGHTYYINVPTSSDPRDFVLQIPVHEHSNNPNRPITYQVRGYNGNTQTGYLRNETFNDNNDEGEIRLDEIPLDNIPTNVNRIRVTIQSPEPNGGSFLIGSIMVTSTTPCCIPTLTCPSDITATAEAGVCEGFPEWTLPTTVDNCAAEVTCSRQPGDAFPIGTTTVICTATDAAGNTDTCEFDVTVEQCDTCVTTVNNITHIDDNDINIGTNGLESFLTNPLYRFANPGLPASGVLTNITLELYARVFEGSCEGDIEVRITDPMGNITIFEQPFERTCDGKGLYHVVLDLPDVPLTGNSVGEWYIEFRDANDQNIGAAEYSVRFARLIYDATFDECYDAAQISLINKNELLSELSEIRLYPVPTSGILNMEYTSDEDNDLFIQIFDSAGKVVSHQKESVILGVNTFNMQVHDLAQGAYYLRIMDNVGRTQVRPFTKVTP